MSVRVEIEPTAKRELLALDAWWQEQRPSAANRVMDEYERILLLLSDAPQVGSPHRGKGVHDVRRIHMRGTPYIVFYHHEPGTSLATIVSVWSSMRKKAPTLAQLKKR